MESLKKAGKPNFDGKMIGTEFIQYFYTNWFGNMEKLVADQIIKPYSKIQYEGNVYEGEQMLLLLDSISKSGYKVDINKFEVYDSGSRQIQIHVLGRLTGNNEMKTLYHFLMLVYQGEKNDSKWTLANSTLMIH
jgi:hypothetical protein